MWEEVWERENVLGEMQESVLGCGEVLGRCEKVLWGVGNVRGGVGMCVGMSGGVGMWESVGEGVEKCIGMWGVEKCWEKCKKVCLGRCEKCFGV